MRRTTARPMPTPLLLVVKKGSKILARFSLGIPFPVSEILMVIALASWSSWTV
jgi:hypothetical protein